MSYSDFSSKKSSEKVVLVHLHAKKEAKLFTNDGSSVYSKSIDKFVMGVSVDNVDYSKSTSSSVASNEFYYDPAIGKLYIHSSTSLDSRQVIVEYRFFYSNRATIATHDLSSSGTMVKYKPFVISVPGFKTRLSFGNDSKSFIGTGKLTLDNSSKELSSLIRDYRLDNKSFAAYSWNPDISFDDSKLIFQGIISSGAVRNNKATFDVKDNIYRLNNETPLSQFSDTEVISNHKKRFKPIIYGFLNGHQLQSIDQVGEGYSLSGALKADSESSEIVGTGTAFLSSLAKGDRLNTNGLNFTARSVVSDTLVIVNETIKSSFSGQSGTVKPSSNWFNKNRTFFVANHALRKVETTISSIITPNRLQLGSISGFEKKDKIEVLGEQYEVSNLYSDIMVLNRSLSPNNFPSVGAVISKREVQKVFIEQEEVLQSDYTISNNSTGSTITLSANTEKNITSENTIGEDITIIKNSDYAILGTPSYALFSISLSSILGSYFRLRGKDGNSKEYVWFKRSDREIRTGSTNFRNNASKTDGDLFIDTDNNDNLFGWDGSSFQQLSTSDDVIVVNIDEESTTSLSHVSSKLKEAIIKANPYQLFSYVSNEWIFLTKEGVSQSLNFIDGNLGSKNTISSLVSVSGKIPNSSINLNDYFKARDFLKLDGRTDTHQVLNCENTFLRFTTTIDSTTRAYTSTAISIAPSYISDTTVVSCSCYGQTEDNNSNGVWIKTPIDSIKNLLVKNNLSSYLNTASFTSEALNADQTVSLRIPYSIDSKAPTVNDAINKLCGSSLGSIGLDNDFKIKLVLLRGSRATNSDNIRIIKESEIKTGKISEEVSKAPLFKFQIKSIDANYNQKASSTDTLRVESAKEEILGDLSTNEEIDLYLGSSSESENIARKYLAFNKRLNRKITIKGALSLQDIDIGQVVYLDFKEFGDSGFIGMVTSFERDGFGVNITVEDFGELFTKTATYASSYSPNYSSATSLQKKLLSFYTDSDGVVGNEESTIGSNLIG
ncbi:virion structural protein [uncultured Mediterranean phage uvMED]|nr:virion structural protein [uncultured Mediterranean phage uvMED]